MLKEYNSVPFQQMSCISRIPRNISKKLSVIEPIGKIITRRFLPTPKKAAYIHTAMNK